MRIGARIHDLVQTDIDGFAEALAQYETDCIQLTAPKVFTDCNLTLQPFSAERGRRIAREIARSGVALPVLSAYVNPLAEDCEAELATFKKYVDYAVLLGARCVGTESGTATLKFEEDDSPNHTPESLEKSISNLLILAEYALSKGMRMGIEAVSFFPICDGETVSGFLRRAPDNVDIIFDPTNLLNARNYWQQAEIFEEFFCRHAERIRVVHLKDFTAEENRLVPAELYRGQLDTGCVFRLLAEYRLDPDFILEESTPNNYAELRNRTAKELKRYGNQAGREQRGI